jgi:hypothetical protein
MLPPVVLATLATSGVAAAREAALTHLKLTHDSPKLWAYAERYAGLLSDVAQVSVGSKGSPLWLALQRQ